MTRSREYRYQEVTATGTLTSIKIGYQHPTYGTGYPGLGINNTSDPAGYKYGSDGAIYAIYLDTSTGTIRWQAGGITEIGINYTTVYATATYKTSDGYTQSFTISEKKQPAYTGTWYTWNYLPSYRTHTVSKGKRWL